MSFIDNKYSRIYNNIVSNAQARILDRSIYTEKHHIVPKSLGGVDNKDNLVSLTAREHFICHRLLTRMTLGENKRKMTYAIWIMCNNKNFAQQNRHVPNSLVYAQIRSAFSETVSAKFKGVKKTYSYWKDKTHTSETKQQQSLIKQGENNPMWGRTQSADTIARITAKQKGIAKPRFICEHCNKSIGGASNYKQHHGSNCKLHKVNLLDGELKLQKN